jgi:hypothetical protein
MKKFYLTLLAVPLLTGCWWNKKPDTLENQMTTEEITADQPVALSAEEFETLVGEAEEDDEFLGRPVGGEVSEK